MDTEIGGRVRLPDTPPQAVKDVVREASRIDNIHGWLYLLGDWSVWIVAIAANVVLNHPITYVIVLVVIGSRMRALANLLHEAAHRKLFATKFLNRIIGTTLCGWPLAVSYSKYIDQHKLHHVHLWDSSRDPDIGLYTLTKTEHGSALRCTRWKFWVIHVLGSVVPVMPIRRLAFDVMPNPKKLVMLTILAALLTLGYVYTDIWLVHMLFLYWLVPFIATYQTIAYWAELGEHGGLMMLGKRWGSRNWHGSLVSRWIIGPHSDDSFHLLHHWFPSVPHYRLSGVDRVCVREWPAYARQHHCSGFFISNRLRQSVIADIWTGAQNIVATDSQTGWA